MIAEIIAVVVIITIKIIIDCFLLANSIARVLVERTRKHGFLTILWLFNWLADLLFMVLIIGAVLLLL